MDKYYIKFILRNRLNFITYCFLIFFLLLILRFFYIQILQNSYYSTQALNNIIKIVPIEPARGLILDRNNTIEEKQETINSLKTKISELEVQVSELIPVTKEAPQIDKAYKKAKESKDKDLNNLTIDQIKILATFFNNDSTIEKNSFKNYVNSNYGLSKTLVDSKFKELSSVIKPQGTIIIEKLFT